MVDNGCSILNQNTTKTVIWPPWHCLIGPLFGRWWVYFHLKSLHPLCITLLPHQAAWVKRDGVCLLVEFLAKLLGLVEVVPDTHGPIHRTRHHHGLADAAVH